MECDFVGRVSYARGLELQARAHALVQGSQARGIVLGLTHDPVMTLGRHASLANLLVSEEVLASKGIALARTDRGGDITYHGPEQVVVYPILHLARCNLTVKSLVTCIEQAMIGYLESLGISAQLRPGAPGVYVGGAKIGFLGLRIKDGISTHGLSLNLGGSLDAFALTNPCGHVGETVTSVQALTGHRPSDQDAAQSIALRLL